MLNDEGLKSATTIQQQIQILKDRGMIINSENSAETLLSRIHYYRFSAYSLGLRKNNIFRPGTTFEQIYRIYKFDEILRRLFFTVIEPIEIKLRASISNYLAIKYGNVCHKDSSIFSDQGQHEKFLEKHNNAIDQMKEVAFVKHHVEVYKDLPIWAAIETWSFGMTSKLFGNLLPEDQKAIALCFGIDEFYLAGWFECLCYIRNICAHNGRLYNRMIVKRPKLFKEDATYYSIKIFPVILMLKRISQGKGATWRTFSDDLSTLVHKYSADINLAFIGFPNNWENLLE